MGLPTASYNGVSFTLQDHGVRMSPRTGPAGGLQGYDCVWVLQGTLEATDASGQLSDLDAILAGALAEPKKTLLITDMDGNTVYEVGAAGSGAQLEDIAQGPIPVVTSPAAHAQKVGFHTPITLEVRFTTAPSGGAGGIVSNEWNDTWGEDKQGRLTRTRTGLLITSAGVSAWSKRDDSSVTPSLPDGYERQQRRFVLEDEASDRRLRYTIVDQQQHQANPTSASDVQYSVAEQVSEGTERWTFAGEIAIPLDSDVEDARAMIKTLAQTAGIPDDVRWHAWAPRFNQRTNRCSFTLTGERAYGNQGVLEFSNAVETESSRQLTVWRARDPNGQDVRQEVHRPIHRITQTFRIVANGGYPAEPKPVAPTADLITKRVRKGKITRDVEGRGMRFPLEGTFVFEPLNRVAAGAHAPAQANLTTDNLDGQSSSQVDV